MKKKLKILGFIVLLFGSYTSLLAQFDSTSFKHRTSLLLSINGQEWFGAYVNHYFTNRISANIGVGGLLDAHVGINYYLFKRNKSESAVYVSAQAAACKKFTLFNDTEERQLVIYIPIGYEYVGKKGFTFQIDMGLNFVSKTNWGQPNTRPFLFSVKIGKTFKAQASDSNWANPVPVEN